MLPRTTVRGRLASACVGGLLALTARPAPQARPRRGHRDRL